VLSDDDSRTASHMRCSYAFRTHRAYTNTVIAPDSGPYVSGRVQGRACQRCAVVVSQNRDRRSAGCDPRVASTGVGTAETEAGTRLLVPEQRGTAPR
jgi:hypothetical protein